MRNERKIVVNLIESDDVHNYRLIAEAVAKKVMKERGMNNDNL